MSPDGRQQLLNEESQQSGADDGEIKIVDHEQAVQLIRRSIPHELPSTEDDDIVRDQRPRRRRKRRHWRDSSLESKILWRIAPNGGERLVEDRP